MKRLIGGIYVRRGDSVLYLVRLNGDLGYEGMSGLVISTRHWVEYHTSSIPSILPPLSRIIHQQDGKHTG